MKTLERDLNKVRVVIDLPVFKSFMLKNNFSYEEFAELAGVSLESISVIFQGYGLTTYHVIDKLACTLGVHPITFILETDEDYFDNIWHEKVAKAHDTQTKWLLDDDKDPKEIIKLFSREYLVDTCISLKKYKPGSYEDV